MKLMLTSDYRLTYQEKDDLLFEHYIAESNNIITALNELTNNHNDQLLAAVQEVSKSKVDYINISKLQCQRGGQVYSVLRLGTAEQMFLVAELTALTNKRCIFLRTMRELSDDNLAKFLKRYKNANIILLEDNENTVNYIRVQQLGKEEGIW